MLVGKKKPLKTIRLFLVGILLTIGLCLTGYVGSVKGLGSLPNEKVEVETLPRGFSLKEVEGKEALIKSTIVGNVGWEVSNGKIEDRLEGKTMLMARYIYVGISAILLWLYWLFMFYVGLRVVNTFKGEKFMFDMFLSLLALVGNILMFTGIAHNNWLGMLENGDSPLYPRIMAFEMSILVICGLAYAYKVKYLRGESSGDEERDRTI